MKTKANLTGTGSARGPIDAVLAALEENLETIAWAGALPVMTDAQERAPVKTGSLRRSIHILTTELTKTRAIASVGPDVPYGRRVELGFIGTDSLGRKYNQAPQPYLRPAFEAKKAEAESEMRTLAKETILEAIQAKVASSAAARIRRQRG